MPVGKQGRIVELDGLRGAAALSVVLAHYFGEVPHRIGALAVGWIGVDVFFVLSGFLVGGILLDNREAPNLLATFYLRRAARIFPVYYVVLLLSIGFSDAARSHGWADFHYPWFVFAAYAQNVAMAFSGRLPGNSFLPMWTLAVEEQFYLLMPLVIRYCPPRYLKWVVAFGIVSAPVLRLIFEAAGNPDASLVLLPCRWDGLLLGVAVAIVQRDHDLRDALVRHTGAVRGVALIAIAVVPISLALAPQLLTTLTLFDLLIVITLFMLLVLNDAPEGARLRWRPLQFFGRVSYCLYLAHQPIANAMHGLILGGRPDIGSPGQVGVTIAAFGVSIGVAMVTWRFIEAPCIAFGKRWQYQRVGVALVDDSSTAHAAVT